MFRPFYSAPVKVRPDFPLLPGQIRLPPPHVLTGPRRPPPPPGSQPLPPAGPPGFHSDKPWMTAHLVGEIRRRNQLQARATRSGGEEDRAAADAARLAVNRLVNDAKERFCLAHPERTDEILQTDRLRRPHHCSSCDRGFSTESQLDEHRREHVRCDIDGCPFTAHPRVVEKHVTMQHQTGLAKVIMALNTPEAVARWREERRARFCRPESAARRQQEQAERAARGLRMGRGRGRFPPGQERAGRGRGAPRANWRGRGRGGAPRPRPPEPASLDSDSDGETGGDLAPFAGILALVDDPASDRDAAGGDDGECSVGPSFGLCGDASPPDGIGDADATAQTTKAGDDTPDADICDRTGCGGDDGAARGTKADAGETEELSSNMGGAVEASVEAPDRTAISHTPSLHTGKPDAAAEDDAGTAASADVNPVVQSPVREAAVPMVSDQRAADACGGRGRGRGRNRRRHAPDQDDRAGSAPQPARFQPPRKRRRPLTLLEKLLAPDIQRERNVILQCVRYMTNHEFFDCQPLGRPRPPVTTTADDVGAAASLATAEPPPPVAPPNGQTANQAESSAAVGPPADDADEPAAEGPEGPPADADSATPTSPERPPALRLLGAAYDSDVFTDSD